jgi:hypothetical protein
MDDAVLLSDRVFGGADTLPTSNVLAAAIRKPAANKALGLVNWAIRLERRGCQSKGCWPGICWHFRKKTISPQNHREHREQQKRINRDERDIQDYKQIYGQAK